MARLKLSDSIAWILLFVLAGLVIHTPVTVWLVSLGAPVGVKAWKEVLVAAAGVLLLVDLIRRKKTDLLRHDPLLWLVAGYGALHLLSLFVGSESVYSVIAGFMIDVRYVAYFAVIYVFLKLNPAYRQSFVRVGIVGAGIVVGCALLQLIAPHDALKDIGYSDATIKPYILLDENPHYVRMNSTLRGPNPLGAYAMIVLLGVFAYGMSVGRALRDSRKKWLYVFLAVGGLAALWISYSRSAWLGLLAGIGVLVVLKHRQRLFGVRQLAAVVLLCALVALIGYAVRDTAMFKNLVLHDNPTTGAQYTSDEGHRDSLKVGIDRLLQQPFGAGIGSTGSASLGSDSPLIIENQYLMVAHEVGWLGLLVFVWLWGAVLWRLLQQEQSWLRDAVLASGLGLMLIACTWPVLVDDPVSMIWWGMAAVALASPLKERGTHGATTHKKTA